MTGNNYLTITQRMRRSYKSKPQGSLKSPSSFRADSLQLNSGFHGEDLQSSLQALSESRFSSKHETIP
ncbi:hypothetical protein OIU79_010665, partial [Salix purpurea]